MENHLPLEVLGFRPGRQAADLLFGIHRVVAKTRATGESLCVAKMDISKAFDSSDLDLTEEAGCHNTPGLAQARHLKLQIPGGNERRRVVKRMEFIRAPLRAHLAHGSPCGDPGR